MKKLLILLTISIFININLSADWGNEEKEIAFDGEAEDRFGHAVSISGDYAVIGAYRDEDFTGSAYIFYYNGLYWAMQAKLTASDGSTGDRFGSSVSISGDYVVVGAYKDDNYITDSGSAYIFQRDGTYWSQQVKLSPPVSTMGDWFGFSVSISGAYAAIGTPYDDSMGDESGCIYIYYNNGSSWSEQEKLITSDGSFGDTLGGSVSISGNYIVASASGDDENGYASGSAYIFHRDNVNWFQQSKLISSDGISWDAFGYRVSISGDYVVVGTPWDDDNGDESGSAYIFARNDTTWAEQAKLTPSNGSADDRFGQSVCISGDYVVIGAPRDDDMGLNSGSANIFKRDGTLWLEQALLTASDGVQYDDYGTSVSLFGNFAVIGSSGDDDNGDDSGSVYFYENLYLAANPYFVEEIDYAVLKPAYPNPFNPLTTISFDIKENETGILNIFNIKGQIIESHQFESGNHNYVWNASKQASGIYFYKLQTPTNTETRKMLLLK